MGRAAEMIDWGAVIERAQRRDAAAFDTIIDAYAGRLMGFFSRMIGRRSEAEDLVQEVFVRVVRTIGDYRDDGRFESWLFKIAGNLARDRIRRDRTAPTREEADEAVIEPKNDSASDLERNEDKDRLQMLLERLPSVEREVVLLRHFAAMSFQEIADYTGCPLGTVLSRAHRGLSKLRSWMESRS